MHREQAVRFWADLLKMTAGGRNARLMLKNPAIKFTQMARDGVYDEMLDADYNLLLAEIEEESSLYEDKPSALADDLLLRAIKSTNLLDTEVERIAKILAQASERIDYKQLLASSPKSKDTAKDIYAVLDKSIYGQEDAKKSASLIVYNHLHERKRNAIFAGPTGCGKSEIWRVLAQKYSFIKMFDASTIAADGWKGSLHWRSIFESVKESERDHMLVVLDEADKMLEPSIANGGVDISLKVQNNLLKILDGDVMTFESEDKRPGFQVDCKHVSVVLLGAFESLLTRKSDKRAGIGFGASVTTRTSYEHDSISTEDFISHGNMRREVAGRIQTVTIMHGMTSEDYINLLRSSASPITSLADQYGIVLTVSDDLQSQLAHDAAESRLGVRYIKSKLQEMIDAELYEKADLKSLYLDIKNSHNNEYLSQ